MSDYRDRNTGTAPFNAVLDPLYQGDSFIVDIQFNDDAGGLVNLTGHTLELTVKEDRASDSDLFQEIQADVDMTNPVQGIASFNASGSETLEWPIGKAYFDVVMTAPSGSIATITSGFFQVLKGIS